MGSQNKKTAIIIGAGPAGLTAAYELLKKTKIKPIVYEMDKQVGGISKTVNYKGNKIDIGGHRFFSKSDEIMKWWLEILPLQQLDNNFNFSIGHLLTKKQVDHRKNKKVMLLKRRLSRIYFLKKFFDYPLSLDIRTIRNLGLYRTFKITLSYLKYKVFPIKPEKNLEDFFINRFGKELYSTFFKDYTEKLWGIPCSKINHEWGAQRIKGLSIGKAVGHAIKSLIKNQSSLEQKNIETSLINYFLYPKYGPGQLWEEVAQIIKKEGGEIFFSHKVVKIYQQKNKITEIKIKNLKTGQEKKIKGDYFFSSMPIKHLITDMEPSPPQNIYYLASKLQYRDFITVGILLSRIKIKNNNNTIIPDNWLYIQEKDVKLGRIQIFNNWSPYLLKDKKNIWIGLEYFCSEGDELWRKTNEEMIAFAINELEYIGIVNKKNVLDGTVIKTKKAYPIYTGTYKDFNLIKKYLNNFENLFLIGRNGMHRYNNQDHSMLAAMTAVDNIVKNIKTKDNIWAINTEQEYHEEKK